MSPLTILNGFLAVLITALGVVFICFEGLRPAIPVAMGIPHIAASGDRPATGSVS